MNPHRQRLTTMNIIWLAMFFSPGFLAASLYLTSKSWTVEISPEALEAMASAAKKGTLFFSMAGFMLLLSFVVPRFLLRTQVMRFRASGANVTETATLETQAGQIYYLVFVIRMALIEAIAIFGFLAALTARDLGLYWTTLGATAMFYLFSRPSLDGIKQVEHTLRTGQA